jgi:hypothetical protein
MEGEIHQCNETLDGKRPTVDSLRLPSFQNSPDPLQHHLQWFPDIRRERLGTLALPGNDQMHLCSAATVIYGRVDSNERCVSSGMARNMQCHDMIVRTARGTTPHTGHEIWEQLGTFMA